MLRPVSNRIDLDALGIENEEMEILDAASDDDGVIDLSKAYPVPPESSTSKTDETVVKILEEKGYVNEEKLYRKEYLLRGTHQLMINGASTAQIAQKLNISVVEARSIKKELVARQINEVRTLDKNKVAGQAIMFYDHIMAKALQIVNKTDTQDKHLRNKIEALKVALQAQTDKQKFLTLARYWDNGLQGNGDSGDAHINGANDVRGIMDAVLTGGTYEITSDDVDKDEIDLM